MTPAGWGGPATAPVVRLDGYEGPIDFLLELARAQKVDLARLSIVELVDQYLAAVEVPGAAALAERGEWLIAASWLVLLRSRLLVRSEDEAEVPEAERLREGLERADRRRQTRDWAGWLERRPQLGREVFGRGAADAADAAAADGAEGGDLLDLLLACFDLMDATAWGGRGVREVDRAFVPPVLDVWSLTEALKWLRARLLERPQGGDLGSFLPDAHGRGVSALRRRSGVVGTFLAALELTRQGVAALEQDQAFAPIRLKAAGWEVERLA